MVAAPTHVGPVTGPAAISGLPDPDVAGVPPITDRRGSWELGRRWGGYPELEWTFPIFVDRTLAVSGRITALFYEWLSDFDTARRMLRVESVLLSRAEPSFPTVSLGFSYFDGAYRSRDGCLGLPRDREPFRGRHWVNAMDHEDMDTIKFINSWGNQWGDNGYGYIDRDYFARHVDEVIVRWSAQGGPSPAMARCLRNYRTRRLSRTEQYVHCWPTPNKYWSQSFTAAGRQHQLLSWDVVSLETSGLVEVFEIRPPLRIIARAHVFHSGSTLVVKELFVVPTMRARGFGSILEELAVDRASSVDAQTIEIWVSAGDARSRLRPALNAFLAKAGYSWSSSQRVRPRIAVIARKELK